MEATTIGLDRRQFLSGVSVAALAGIPFGVLPTESEQVRRSGRGPSCTRLTVSAFLSPADASCPSKSIHN